MVKQDFKVIWDDEAKASLRRIYNYIKRRESVDQANKVRNEIRDLCRNLGFMPSKFSREEYLKDVGGEIRFKTLWSYKVIYEVTTEYVVILDIFHTSRDPLHITKLKSKSQSLD
jgi:plasmid stabilization system protein ParE